LGLNTLRITAPSERNQPLGKCEAKAPPPAGLPVGSPSVHLDALRGFAAFSVLLEHWRDAFFADYGALAHHNPVIAAAYLLTGLGHQWVIVFFVMSGYLVGGSVLRSVNAGRWSWRSYALARLTRLYIVLLPALFLGGAIDWVGMHTKGTGAIYSGQSGMHSLTRDIHFTLTPSVFVENSLFLQTIAIPGMRGQPVPAFGSNGPLWSLSNELWYYVAFPLLVLLLVSRQLWRILVICGVGLLAWGWFVGAGIVLLGVPWLMGAMISVLPRLPVDRPWVRRWAIISAMALFCGGLLLGKVLQSLFSDLVLGLVVSLLIWVILQFAISPLSVLYVQIARRAAHSSYTLYLIHLPMLIFLKAWLQLPRALLSWDSCLISGGLLVGVLIYAQIIYQLFEKNTDRVRNWIKPYVLDRQLA
jgi:peptidoglycan/LPS O-acetylase OafA/YrhL